MSSQTNSKLGIAILGAMALGTGSGTNKIILGNKTLIDLTGDTVTKETLAKNVVAHNAAGNRIVGTLESAEGVTFGYVKDSTTEEWLPAERDEQYLVSSAVLNDIARKVGAIAGTTDLLTLTEVLNYLDQNGGGT